MSWSCEGCGATSHDDVATCPSCGGVKSSWTIAGDHTRTMVVGTTKRFSLLRGESAAAAPPREPPYADERLALADVAPVVTARDLRALSQAGQVPAGRHVLFVRLQPGKAPDRSVTLSLDFAMAGRAERRLTAGGALAGDHVDLRLVLFRADGTDLGGVTFPGVELVDVSEETERGFAPEVEVAALGRPPQALPTSAPGVPVRLRLQDERGQSLASVEVRSAATVHATDAGGLVELDLPGDGDVLVLPVGRLLPVRPAALDPSRSLVGVQQRLLALGYAPGPLDPPTDKGVPAVPYRLRRAIESFQADQGLGVDGIPGPATQGQLVAVIGG